MTISKSTGVTVSLALVVSIAAVSYGIGTKVTTIEADGKQNTRDIATLTGKIDTLNENLTTANGNIIKLNARLDAMSGQNTVSSNANVNTPKTQEPVTQQTSAKTSNGSDQPQSNEPAQDPAPLASLIKSTTCNLLSITCGMQL